MIRVIRQGEKYVSPGFIKDLKLIDAEFCPFWDRKAERWLIVRFLPVREEVPESIRRRGYIIEFCVSKGRDYTPLDSRTIYSLQVISYLKHKLRVLDEHLKDLQESDDALGEEGLKAWQAAKREFLKKLYKFSHEKTFV